MAATARADLSLEDDLLRLKMITVAKERGMSWVMIGRGLGMSGREAKRHAHKLARSCQRRLVTQDAAR